MTDAAGNVSEARAEFVIDHTEPNIIFEGIENGGCYEEPVDIKILTEQESDQITDILINGERQEQNRVDGSFGFMFEKVGKYELFVKAEDLAGNVSDKKLSFEIRQKPKNILEKIFYQKGEGRKGDIRAREKAEKQGLYLAGGLAGIAIVCPGIGYKKKKAH